MMMMMKVNGCITRQLTGDSNLFQNLFVTAAGWAMQERVLQCTRANHFSN
jgi:hypothetical protein